MSVTSCTSCEAMVEWLPLRKKNGEVIAHLFNAETTAAYVFVNGAWEHTHSRVSHFATCPFANEHRKKKEPAV